MTQEQIEKNRKLLSLKGVETEEDTIDAVVPAQVLEQFQQRKAIQLDQKTLFDDLELEWKNGMLSRLVAYKNGEVLYEMHFAWNADGSLSKIMRV